MRFTSKIVFFIALLSSDDRTVFVIRIFNLSKTEVIFAPKRVFSLFGPLGNRPRYHFTAHTWIVLCVPLKTGGRIIRFDAIGIFCLRFNSCFCHCFSTCCESPWEFSFRTSFMLAIRSASYFASESAMTSLARLRTLLSRLVIRIVDHSLREGSLTNLLSLSRRDLLYLPSDTRMIAFSNLFHSSRISGVCGIRCIPYVASGRMSEAHISYNVLYGVLQIGSQYLAILARHILADLILPTLIVSPSTDGVAVTLRYPASFFIEIVSFSDFKIRHVLA